MAAAAALSLAIGVAQGLAQVPPRSQEVADISPSGEQRSAAAAFPTDLSPVYCSPVQVRLKLPASCGEG